MDGSGHWVCLCGCVVACVCVVVSVCFGNLTPGYTQPFDCHIVPVVLH